MPKPDAGALYKFRLFETDEYQKCLSKLPRSEIRFLSQKLDEYVYPQLRENPFWGMNIKKLKGYAPNVWRYRIGKFRIFFHIDEQKRTVFY
ncbi:MAG TPA: type II toxin-antitoxin system RelE/ParE family toxin [Candidatus Hydrogenedentes bacterium]|nr:type II toxin-antitoxin system RelE/ParE family toxin [Candidatus Hydrogenedentota bacterium]